MLSKRRKEDKERDYLPSKQLDVKSFAIEFYSMEMFMLRYGMKYAAFRDLVSIYRSWINDGMGLTAYSIVREGKTYGNTFQACYARLRILGNKGFIQVIGYRDKFSIYAPTDKAIRELKELSLGD